MGNYKTSLANYKPDISGGGVGFMSSGFDDSYATNTTYYVGIGFNGASGAGTTGTEGDVDIQTVTQFTTKRLTVKTGVNTKNVAVTVGFRDDGVTVVSVSLTASTTGVFTTLEDDIILASSMINWIIDTSGSASGSLRVDFLTVEIKT